MQPNRRLKIWKKEAFQCYHAYVIYLMMPDFCKKHIYLIALGFLSIAFSIVYSIPYWETMKLSREYNNEHIIFNSPDETANYVFLRQYAANGMLKRDEPINAIAGSVVHPRSVNVVSDSLRKSFSLVPTHFLGIFFLYGSFGRLFGNHAMLFFTPIIAAFSAFSLYVILGYFFEKKVAFLSAILLLFHPAYWYYASRGLFSNVLFLDLLLLSFAAFAFSTRKTISRHLVSLLQFCSGAFLGLSLIVRPSEAVWVLLVFVIILIFGRKRCSLAAGTLFLLPLIISLTLILIANTEVYGRPFATGYESTKALAALEKGEFSWITRLNSSSVSLRALWSGIFLPFGFHPRLVWENVKGYIFQLFSLPAFLALIGGLLLFIDSKRQLSEEAKKRRLFICSFVAASGYLIAVYGSWLLSDNVSGSTPSIGVSYVRYWLPIFVFSLPFSTTAMLLIAGWFRKGLKVYILITLLAAFFLFSARVALLAGDESLLAVRKTIQSYYETEKRVHAALTEDAILLVDRSDKIFWPKRRVISYFNNDAVFASIKAIIDTGVPVYYYLHTELSPDLLEKMRQETLPRYNLAINEYKKFGEGDYLYTLQRVNPPRP